MVDCPLCRCEMRVCIERDVELKMCDPCHGVWLDAAELAKLAVRSEEHDLSWSLPADQGLSQTTFDCSQCLNTPLEKVLINDYPFLGCRACHGLFVDCDTLDNITMTDDDEDQSEAMPTIAGGILNALSLLLIGGTFLGIDSDVDLDES